MKTSKKPLKFYLIMFGFSVILIGGYSLYMILAQDQTVNDVAVLWLMPFVFTGIYYGSDVLIDKFSNRKKKVDYEARFLGEISEVMRNSGEFIVEEFRKLQNNQKFQYDLKRAYLIYKDGEDENNSIDRLERKYRKDTLEKRAMDYVVKYLKENKEIPESD